MKRKVAIWLMLAANIVMLAHAVVPHHRHSRALAAAVIHFLNYGAQEAETSAHGDGGEDGPAAATAAATAHRHGAGHHDGDHHEGDEDCRVDEACIAAFTLRRPDGPDAAASACAAPHIDLAPGEDTLSAALRTAVPAGTAYRPYAEDWLGAWTPRAAGLRAPPVC